MTWLIFSESSSGRRLSFSFGEYRRWDFLSGLEFAGFRHVMGTGWYHLALWVGLVIPLVLMAVPSIRRTNWGKVSASVLFLVGMLAGRLEFVLGGLVMPTGPKAEGQPQFVSYWPTIWEVFVVLFALSVLLTVYTYGERNFKLGEVSGYNKEG